MFEPSRNIPSTAVLFKGAPAQQTHTAARQKRKRLARTPVEAPERMTLRDRHELLRGSSRASLSPPAWKDQLKQRCMLRLRQDRHKLLAKLRRPDAATSIAEEMKRLVHTEEERDGHDRRQGCHPVFDLQQDGAVETTARTGGVRVDAQSSVDDLLYLGKLSEDDYLDLVHTLEDALRQEVERDAGADEEILAQEMMDFEDASLDALLAGMDLEGDAGPTAPVLAEEAALQDIASPTGTYSMQFRFGATCSSDPTFAKKASQPADGFLSAEADALRITCHDCGCDSVLP
ncbi:hypothetical protein BBJ28_00009585 [Nothophytophthora sp. Chile5]|nr:hypothetical protein BBJ28_00009585 [Nothophytophthora sp. Chile5]